MSGGGKLGNMGGGVTRGERNVIVPLNFRIRVRHLLPLPIKLILLIIKLTYLLKKAMLMLKITRFTINFVE